MLQGQLQGARNAWQLQVAKKGQLSSRGFWTRSPPCPARDEGLAGPRLFRASSPSSLQEIPSSPARGILMESWVLRVAGSFSFVTWE